MRYGPRAQLWKCIAKVGKIENKEVKVFTSQMFMNNLFGC